MTEENVSESTQSVGKKMQQARLARGLSVAQVAIDLNLLNAYIEGLESGDYTAIKSDVFVKGYIRTYGNYLKLDVAVLLEQYQQKMKPSKENISAPKSALNLPVIPVVGAGALIAIVLIWTLWPSSTEKNVIKTVSVPAELVEIIAEEKIDEGTVNTNTTEDEKPLIQDKLTLTEDVVFDAVESENGQLKISDPAVNEDLVLRVNEDLVLRFNNECWVEVRDNAGRVLLADLKQDGDEVSLSGEPPYKVVIGDAAAVEIFYAGKAVEVNGRGENNTAKLVVGE